MKDKLQQLFRNNSDCYADTWKHEGEKLTEGDVIQAMTEEKFIQCVTDFVLNERNSVDEGEKPAECLICGEITNKHKTQNCPKYL